MSQGFAPFYDVNRTYEDNYLQGPFGAFAEVLRLMRPILRDRSRLLLLRLRPIPPVRFRRSDHSGRSSAGIPWFSCESAVRYSSWSAAE